MQSRQVAEKVAAELSKQLDMPYDVQVGYAECGEANASYDPRSKTVTVCYELMEFMVYGYYVLDPTMSRDDAVTHGLNAVEFALFHETGHALIDTLKIPIVVREEDAADGVAAFLMVSRDNADSVLDAAQFFVLLSSYEKRYDVRAASDVHSPDLQRAFNLACWLYGSSPGKWSKEIVTRHMLPAERSASCLDEYSQLTESWHRLLGDHLKLIEH